MKPLTSKSSWQSQVTGPLRIQAVVELTGVAAPTLRAWERRYGVPEPARTASAYRLYRAEDVAEVARMRELCAQGIAAAEAAETVMRERSERRSGSSEDAIAQAIDRLLAAAFRLDGGAFDRALANAAELGNASMFFESIVTPALARIGDLWECGEMSIAHEHFASARVQPFVRSRLRMIEPADASAPSVLLAGIDEEQHVTGLLGVALRFASWGYRPIELGPRVPPSAARDAVAAVKPAIVALSVTVPLESARAKTLARDYASAVGEVPWIVGGSAVETIASHVTRYGGFATSESLANLHSVVRAALARRRKK